jgi:hypothetical protein
MLRDVHLLTERVEVKLSEFEGFARFFQTETNPNALRSILAMSLENIVARAELERHGYHELSEEQLHLKDDPEALLQRGIRLWLGIADGSLSLHQQSLGIL